MEKWIERVKKCMAINGDYVEKYVFSVEEKFPTFWYNCYYFTWSDTYFIQLETLLINHLSYESDHIERETSRAVWRKTLNDVWHSIGKSWHGSISGFLKLVVSIHTCTLTSCDVSSLNWCCYWRRVKKAACRWYHAWWWMDPSSLPVCITRAERGLRIRFSVFHLFWI